MKISPMDIQRQTFANKFRGLDREEVRTYLALVAEEVAALQRERDALDQKVQSLQYVVDEARDREAILKNTLLTAQKASEEIRDIARRQAENQVKEAELQADRLIELAQSRAHEVERGILDLRGHRTMLHHPPDPSPRPAGRGGGGGQPALPEAAGRDGLVAPRGGGGRARPA